MDEKKDDADESSMVSQTEVALELQQEVDVGREWTPRQWQALLDLLVANSLVTWQEVTALVLGQLNPPQVGTSLASNKNVQAHFPKRETWKAVRAWLYEQNGICENCGTRLDLQADHIQSKEDGGPDTLDNFQLLCRRCNVIKRPSHKYGGQTYLTAEAALMWLIFVRKPDTYDEYQKLCREYGLTMATIRFQEAWAIVEWLRREDKYPLQDI